MEYVLFALRILMALLLLSFLAAILFLLLREPSQSAISRTANTPFAPQPAKLIVLEAEQGNPRTFELTRNSWLGRDPNSLIYIEDVRVSARHAQLVWDAEAESWFIEDNASRNGTLVNGAHVVRQTLAEGDVIAVGEARFTFTKI